MKQIFENPKFQIFQNLTSGALKKRALRKFSNLNSLFSQAFLIEPTDEKVPEPQLFLERKPHPTRVRRLVGPPLGLPRWSKRSA